MTDLAAVAIGILAGIVAGVPTCTFILWVLVRHYQVSPGGVVVFTRQHQADTRHLDVLVLTGTPANDGEAAVAPGAIRLDAHARLTDGER